MSLVAELFPLIAFLGVTVLGLYALIIRGKLAKGSQSAGPILTPVQDVHGLNSEAWDVASIGKNLKANKGHTLGMVSSLCQSVGIDSNHHYGISEQSVQELVERLEQHLELDRFSSPSTGTANTAGHQTGMAGSQTRQDAQQ